MSIAKQQDNQSPRPSNTGDNDVEVLTSTAEADYLTAEEIKFSRLVAKGMSLTTAYRKAYEHKKDLSYSTIRRYAFQLYANNRIKSEVETVKETQARLARLAEDRLEQILVEDESSTKGSKVADVAMFMYDHVNGKATQRIEQHTTGITFTLDLTGAQTAPEDD